LMPWGLMPWSLISARGLVPNVACLGTSFLTFDL
jgi:hypothetical protein